MSAAARSNQWLVLALLALHLAWNGAGLWGAGSKLALLALGLPLAVAAGLHVAARPSARFWSGVVALLTFCHGVMEAWAEPPARVPAIAEIVFSLAIVASASWDGILARFSRRRGPPPAV